MSGNSDEVKAEIADLKNHANTIAQLLELLPEKDRKDYMIAYMKEAEETKRAQAKEAEETKRAQEAEETKRAQEAEETKRAQEAEETKRAQEKTKQLALQKDISVASSKSRNSNLQTTISRVARVRDGHKCVVSGAVRNLKGAHIIGHRLYKETLEDAYTTLQKEWPEGEWATFTAEDLWEMRGTDSEIITLEGDIHTDFDNGCFYFDTDLKLVARAPEYKKYEANDPLSFRFSPPHAVYFRLNEILTRKKYKKKYRVKALKKQNGYLQCDDCGKTVSQVDLERHRTESCGDENAYEEEGKMGIEDDLEGR